MQKRCLPAHNAPKTLPNKLKKAGTVHPSEIKHGSN